MLDGSDTGTSRLFPDSLKRPRVQLSGAKVKVSVALTSEQAENSLLLGFRQALSRLISERY